MLNSYSGVLIGPPCETASKARRSPLPAVGDLVTCRVTRINPRMASVDILCVGATALREASAGSVVGGAPNFGVGFEVVNETILSMRFGGHPEYSIWVPETISLTVPARAVKSDHVLLAASQLIIYATPGRLQLSGTLVEEPSEATLASRASMLRLTLRDDLWAPDVGLVSCERGNLK